MQPIPIKKDQDQAKEIFLSFRAWSFYSKAGNYAGMLAVCYPNSMFAEISNMCKRSGDMGIRFYYEFEKLAVVSINNEGKEAVVKGNIKLIQTGSGNVFKGCFRASCFSRQTSAPVHSRQTTSLWPAQGQWSDDSADVYLSWKLSEIVIDWED